MKRIRAFAAFEGSGMWNTNEKLAPSCFGAVLMAFSLAGCGSLESGNTAMPSVSSSSENITETKPVAEDGIFVAAESSAETDKIVIAYFTWAENATDTSGVDATTSASVQAPGNVAQMAAWIQQETGGAVLLHWNGWTGIQCEGYFCGAAGQRNRKQRVRGVPG